MRILILGICCFVFLVGGTEYGYTQYKLFNGADWQMVDAYNFSSAQKEQIKLLFLKSVFEVTLFSGNPTLSIDVTQPDFVNTYNETFALYPDLIDEFYSNPENLNFPLFFALKIVDMVHSGVNKAEIQKYKMDVISTLRGQGMWEE